MLVKCIYVEHLSSLIVYLEYSLIPRLPSQVHEAIIEATL